MINLKKQLFLFLFGTFCAPLFSADQTKEPQSSASETNNEMALVPLVVQPKHPVVIPNGAIIIMPNALAAFHTECQKIQRLHVQTIAMQKIMQKNSNFIEQAIQKQDGRFACLKFLSKIMRVEQVGRTPLPQFLTLSGLVPRGTHDTGSGTITNPGMELQTMLSWVNMNDTVDAFIKKMKTVRNQEIKQAQLHANYPKLDDTSYQFPKDVRTTFITSLRTLENSQLTETLLHIFEKPADAVDILTPSQMMVAAALLRKKEMPTTDAYGIFIPFPMGEAYTSRNAQWIGKPQAGETRNIYSLSEKETLLFKNPIKGLHLSNKQFLSSVCALLTVILNQKEEKVNQQPPASRSSTDGSFTTAPNSLYSTPLPPASPANNTIPLLSKEEQTIRSLVDNFKTVNCILIAYKKPLLCTAAIGGVIAAYGILYKQGRTAPGMAPFAATFKAARWIQNLLSFSITTPIKERASAYYKDSLVDEAFTGVKNSGFCVFNYLCPKIT